MKALLDFIVDILKVPSVLVGIIALIAFTLMTIYSVKFFIFDFIKMTKQGDTQ